MTPYLLCQNNDSPDGEDNGHIQVTFRSCPELDHVSGGKGEPWFVGRGVRAVIAVPCRQIDDGVDGKTGYGGWVPDSGI